MTQPEVPLRVQHLKNAVKLTQEKILNQESVAFQGGITTDGPVLVVLVAGKGTRFGQEPKCIQRVHRTPLARHSIDAFRRFYMAPVICLVGYRYSEVSTALGNDNIYILSDNPTGGTAYATFEAFCIPGSLEKNPLLIITMGDRVVPSSVFRNLWKIHTAGDQEAYLTFLTALYEPPKNRGKGRVLRDENRQIVRIMEERDILEEKDILARQALLNLTEGNCPLYTIRAATLYRHLQNLTNANVQGQFYLTDIIHLIHHTDQWIECVTRSQQGDCCVDIQPDRLPSGKEMTGDFEWERGTAGPQIMNLWMEKYGAKPFDYNRGLDDESLSGDIPPEFHKLEGSSFFRGLTLIDLAEAMLKRIFEKDAVVVRVNAAGQGDYFQVHLDRLKVNTDDVKQFIRKAFYSRFVLLPDQEFVEVHSGGGTVGVRLSRYDSLLQLVQLLQNKTNKIRSN